MARKTAKYRAGSRTHRELHPDQVIPKENADLYRTLEQAGYWWDARQKLWQKSVKPSTSIFENNSGQATGIAKIRLMCHPDDTDYFLEALRGVPEFRVLEISDETYANRNGAGERCYLTVVREGGSL